MAQPTHPAALPWTTERLFAAAAAAASNALSLVTFFFLPYAHLFDTDFTAAGWVGFLSGQDPNTAIVWIIPLLTGVVAVLALTQMGPTDRPSTQLRSLWIAFFLQVVVVGGYSLNLLMMGRGIGALRAGFWLGFGTALAALIALALAISTIHRWRTTSPSWR